MFLSFNVYFLVNVHDNCPFLVKCGSISDTFDMEIFIVMVTAYNGFNGLLGVHLHLELHSRGSNN